MCVCSIHVQEQRRRLRILKSLAYIFQDGRL